MKYEELQDQFEAAMEDAVSKHRDYAARLAVTLWEKHWKSDAPNWSPAPDLMTVLSQIDNMTTGLVRKPSN